MKAQTGIVTGREIKINRDGSRPRRLLQVQVTSPDDVQTVEHYGQSGDDAGPPDGARVLILDLGRAYKVAVAVDDLQSPEASPGEHRIYSVDGEDLAAVIYLRTDGTAEILGADDFAVRFSALETAYNELQQRFNDFISHVHGGIASGASSTSPATGTPSTGDISAAKVDNVKLP